MRNHQAAGHSQNTRVRKYPAVLVALHQKLNPNLPHCVAMRSTAHELDLHNDTRVEDAQTHNRCVGTPFRTWILHALHAQLHNPHVYAPISQDSQPRFHFPFKVKPWTPTTARADNRWAHFVLVASGATVMQKRCVMSPGRCHGTPTATRFNHVPWQMPRNLIDSA